MATKLINGKRVNLTTKEEAERAAADAAWAAKQPERDAEVALQTKRDAMKADFMGLNEELRAAYWEDFRVINELLDIGDLGAAKKRIRLIDIKSKLSAENKAAFETVRQGFETKLDEI